MTQAEMTTLRSGASFYDWQHPIIQDDLANIAAQALPWQDLANRHVILTGATGLWGRFILYSLLYLNDHQNLNIKITAIVRNPDRAHEIFNAVKHRPDVAFYAHDLAQLHPFDLPQSADVVIHAASQAGPAFYGVDPIGTALPNTTGLAHLLDWSVKSSVEKFLFVSSSEVYGQLRADQIPTAETQLGMIDPATVRACYGESKRMGETLCMGWHQQTGLNTFIVRPFHTYGPGLNLHDGRVFADFIKAIMAGDPLTIRGDGSPTRAFCYIADAVAALWTVLLKGEAATPYNIGVPTETSILQLATQLVEKAFPERYLALHVGQAPAQQAGNYLASVVSRNVPEVSRLMALGWRPWTDLIAGFQRTVHVLEATHHGGQP
jgi:nucleoside-diphosphate-sugar epimerase